MRYSFVQLCAARHPQTKPQTCPLRVSFMVHTSLSFIYYKGHPQRTFSGFGLGMSCGSCLLPTGSGKPNGKRGPKIDFRRRPYCGSRGCGIDRGSEAAQLILSKRAPFGRAWGLNGRAQVFGPLQHTLRRRASAPVFTRRFVCCRISYDSSKPHRELQ